ncbi:MAG TPA: hypothetical protein VGD98_15005 [Ktedonobacteraceae bacterium]
MAMNQCQICQAALPEMASLCPVCGNPTAGAHLNIRPTRKYTPGNGKTGAPEPGSQQATPLLPEQPAPGSPGTVFPGSLRLPAKPRSQAGLGEEPPPLRGLLRPISMAPTAPTTPVPASDHAQITPAPGETSESAPLSSSSSASADDELDMSEHTTTSIPKEEVYKHFGLASENLHEEMSPERFAATIQAAERWRKSWQGRQHTEADPAHHVSRGQADVPMPLITQSPSEHARESLTPRTSTRSRSGFWLLFALLLIAIGGILVYLLLSFLCKLPA